MSVFPESGKLMSANKHIEADIRIFIDENDLPEKDAFVIVIPRDKL